MAAVTIGSARIDENGRASGGKAGDQTGREVGTQDWYKHDKGWVVLRPKDADAAAKIAKAMRAACKNEKIGYDQGQRNTLYTQAKPLGFDPSEVTAACETDCSALVRVCCAFAGITVSDFTTGDQAAVLMASGKFQKLTDTKYTASSTYLRAGDILVTKTKGHTAVVLTNGSKAEPVIYPANPLATTPQQPAAPVHGVRITGGLVNLRTGPGTEFKATRTAKQGEMFEPVILDGWRPILVAGQVLFVSEKLSEEV